MITLLVLEPGHFHAALLLKRDNPRISRDVHLYASAGPERDAFVNLVSSFNARATAPTGWRIHLHEAPDAAAAMARLIAERRGDAVVIAGRNRDKLGTIARLHEAGFWVLADKPWIVDARALGELERACSGAPLAMDIMPDRHEVLARLRKRITRTPEIFGEFAVDDPRGPAIELCSTHHLYKIVNGRPLSRPAWYYDARVQGDGVVDVQSHLTDQAQWLVAEGHTFAYERDVRLQRAVRWATPVSLDLFRASTGHSHLPDALRPWIRDDVLHYPCNAEVRYELRGVSVRQEAVWGAREPEGGGDLHPAVLRGTRCVLEVRHGAHTGFTPELHLLPRPGVDPATPLAEAAAAWQADFPGLELRPEGDGTRFAVPAHLHSSHESHFAEALEEFLDYVQAGAWPDDLQSRIHARYRLLAGAHTLASAGEPA